MLNDPNVKVPHDWRAVGIDVTKNYAIAEKDQPLVKRIIDRQTAVMKDSDKHDYLQVIVQRAHDNWMRASLREGPLREQIDDAIARHAKVVRLKEKYEKELERLRKFEKGIEI